MNSPIAAVLFDVGGVLQLLDHDRVEAALRPSGREVDRERTAKAHYVALAEVEERSESTDEPVLQSDWLEAYVRALGVSQDHQRDVVIKLDQQLSDGDGWNDVIAGAPEVLRELQGRGLKLGIISNTPLGGVARRLETAAICQIGEGDGVTVEVVIDSYEVGVKKPHPAIFEAAAQGLGVSPDMVAFVGDSLIADVRGSEAVGMHPIHFDPYSLCGMDDHRHAKSLSDIPRLIDGI